MQGRLWNPDFTFWLGTHEVHWLGRTSVPLFISRRRLSLRKAMPRALGRWALDSGGFSELSMFGKWVTTPEQYVGEVRRYQSDIGRLEWAAIQDWMCEHFVTSKTGLTVREHQRRTVESALRLRDLAHDLPWAPVLQGWTVSDYLRHRDEYTAAGLDLASYPVVGVGTMCRRQTTWDAGQVLAALSGFGLQLHAFGFKVSGLARHIRRLTSSDSMAWSYAARRRVAQCGKKHKCCANCLSFALKWRDELCTSIGVEERMIA